MNSRSLGTRIRKRHLNLPSTSCLLAILDFPQSKASLAVAAEIVAVVIVGGVIDPTLSLLPRNFKLNFGVVAFKI